MGFNIAELQRAHEAILRKSENAISDEMGNATRFAVGYVAQHSRFVNRTGALAKATKALVVRTSGGKLVRVSNAKKYANAIDLGAKPHVIRPRRAKRLRFVVGGKVVFARKVNHPGNKPYRFLYRATNAAARVAVSNIEIRLTRIAREQT